MPMIPERRERLSRFLALILRHQGPKTGLQFDGRGATAIGPLIEHINRNELFRWVQPEHLEEIVATDPKGRYAIEEGMMRATYGHSFSLREPSDPVEPPERLYYGVPERLVRWAVQSGLAPSGRVYLHLSTQEQEALDVASRQDRRAAVVEIDAKSAHMGGVKFYRANDKIYLALSIPAKFVRVKSAAR
jgi:putative RNA 2'-phosphotransferase